MKLKGVSAFEQHVEKIVLVVVSVILLAVVTMQFLLQPNRVTVGRAAPVPPGEAYRPVEALAEDLRRRIQDTQPALPEVPQVDLAAEFQRRREAPLAPQAPRVSLGRSIPLEGVAVAASAGAAGEAPVADLAIPAPTGAVAAALWSAIDPAEAIANPALMAMLPPEQPFDKVSVSVEGVFDGTALRRALMNDPDGESGPVRAVPSQWWLNSIEILAVRLQREELTDTGEWTNLVDVASPPGRVDVLDEVRKTVFSLPDLSEWVNEARIAAEDIRRPLFYPVIAGQPWVAPSEAVKGAARRPPEVDREFRLRDQTAAQLAAAQDALDAARRGAGIRPQPGEGGGRGRAGPGAGDPQRPAQPRTDPKVTFLEGRVKNLTDQLRKVDERIIALGYDPETGGKREALAAAAQTFRALLDDAAVRLWMHDLTAEPGKTYRYRMHVAVNNPLYGRGAGLVADQQERSRQAVVLGEPSAWTDPVTVPPQTCYFITGASTAGELGGSVRATAEVYRMFYGFYRRGTVNLEPGDVIASDVRLPDKMLLPIWDLEKLRDPQAQPGFIPPPPVPGGEGEIVPGGRPGIVTPPGFPAPPPPPGDPQTPTLPPGATPWEKPVAVAMTTFLLDVARAPIAGEAGLSGLRERYQAFLRGPDGQIAVRYPDQDRDSDLYALVTTSAKEGETQGVPPEPEPEKTPIRIPGREPRERQPEGGGGGGGGG